MNEDTRQVLELLSQGKVSVPEAEQLLQAVKMPEAPTRRRASRATSGFS